MKIVTMNRLLQNPSGPYSAYFARRDLTIKNLNERYLQMLKDKKEFKLEIFKEKDDYYFYFKVPSEKYDKLFYDVVIKFTPVESQSNFDLTFNNYAVNLFSNSPNFMFTYAYVYNEDGILVDFLKDRISQQALNEPPNIKNPIQSYGFEKSVYFALLYIRHNRFHVKSSINHRTKPLDRKKLHKAVDSSEDKLKQYNRAKANEKSLKDSQKIKKKPVAESEKTSYNKKVQRLSEVSLEDRVQKTERNRHKKLGDSRKKANSKVNMKRNMSLKKKK
jgi:hypothetical protein